MATPLLALTLGIAAEVWAGTEGFGAAPEPERSSCSSEAFAAAVRAQRPTADVHAWLVDDPTSRPPAAALRAMLTQRGADVILEVVGTRSNATRTLPARRCGTGSSSSPSMPISGSHRAKGSPSGGASRLRAWERSPPRPTTSRWGSESRHT